MLQSLLLRCALIIVSRIVSYHLYVSLSYRAFGKYAFHHRCDDVWGAVEKEWGVETEQVEMMPVLARNKIWFFEIHPDGAALWLPTVSHRSAKHFGL